MRLKVLTGGSALPTGLARRARDMGVTCSLIYGGSDQLATSVSVVPENLPQESDAAWEALGYLKVTWMTPNALGKAMSKAGFVRAI